MDVIPTLKRYPVQVTLEDGTRLTLRLLEPQDKIPLAQFFQRVSEEDRFYLKESVSSPEVIRRWTENIDLERVIPIVAIMDGKIVADATLHRSRAPARQHAGELRVVVDPDHRGKGLGTRMIQELIDLGKALGLEKLFFELVDRREMGAIHTAIRAGFEEVAILKGRVKDIYGSLQDLSILEMSLETDSGEGHI